MSGEGCALSSASRSIRGHEMRIIGEREHVSKWRLTNVGKYSDVLFVSKHTKRHVQDSYIDRSHLLTMVTFI